MPADAPRRAELLAFEDAEGSLRALVDALRLEGLRVDEAGDLDGLRTAFFEAGGHQVLLLGPGLPERVAVEAARSLREVDPELRVVTFGSAGRGEGWPEASVVRLQAHHPAARSALGAVLRVLATRID